MLIYTIAMIFWISLGVTALVLLIKKTKRSRKILENKILINNEWYNCGQYKNGDILTIIEKREFGYYAITNKGIIVYIAEEECEEI